MRFFFLNLPVSSEVALLLSAALYSGHLLICGSAESCESWWFDLALFWTPLGLDYPLFC